MTSHKNINEECGCKHEKMNKITKFMKKKKELINESRFDFSMDKVILEEVAMGVQGSGWVYLATDGNIKTIKNHEVKSDILFLVDWWEHAWILDYGSDKKKYLKDIWKIINWNVISTRWGKSL